MKTLIAALLILGGLVAVLCGWGISGWNSVQHEQAALVDKAHLNAVERARLAADVAGDAAEQVRYDESTRPYFHYQSLFHDPRGSDNNFVAPSPLASGPPSELIAGQFQLRELGDGKLEVSMPTINDEFPEVSAVARLAHDTLMRERLRAQATQIAAAAPPVMDSLPAVQVASVATPPARRITRRATVPSSNNAVGNEPPVQSAQVIELTPQQYQQNVESNLVYGSTRGPSQTKAAPPPVVEIPAAKPVRRRAAPTPPPVAAPISIIVPPLQWATITSDSPSAIQVLALRRVATPEGQLVQGFELDQAALLEQVRDTVGVSPSGQVYPIRVVATQPGDRSQQPIAGLPWAIAVDDSIDQRLAGPAIASLSSEFFGRFVPIAILAAICGILGVVVVARAERLASERARFAAAAAHELRTPLAGIQLYGDMLAGGLGDKSKTARYASRISEDASRLGRVVANVLGFAQLERGNLSVAVTDGDAQAAAARALDQVQSRFANAGVVAELVDGPPVMARFDDDAVARILTNLLDNAEKYCRDAADRRITVAVTAVGDAVHIAVTDRGPGVSAKLRRQLFRPFTRGGSVDGPNGLGLGLSLSRSLARSMGGELSYRPAATGATFVLVLRRATTAAKA